MTPEEYNAQQEYLLTHPQTITKLQAMKQLKVLNLDRKDPLVASLGNPLVASLGKSLNLTDTDIDNLFAEASKL